MSLQRLQQQRVLVWQYTYCVETPGEWQARVGLALCRNGRIRGPPPPLAPLIAPNAPLPATLAVHVQINIAVAVLCRGHGGRLGARRLIGASDMAYHGSYYLVLRRRCPFQVVVVVDAIGFA